MQPREILKSESDHVDYDYTRTLYLGALFPGMYLLFSGTMDLDSGFNDRDGKTGRTLHEPIPKRIYDCTVGSISFLLGAGFFAAGAVIATPIAAVTTIPMDLYAHGKKHGFFSKSNQNPLTPGKNEDCKPHLPLQRRY